MRNCYHTTYSYFAMKFCLIDLKLILERFEEAGNYLIKITSGKF